MTGMSYCKYSCVWYILLHCDLCHHFWLPVSELCRITSSQQPPKRAMLTASVSLRSSWTVFSHYNLMMSKRFYRPSGRMHLKSSIILAVCFITDHLNGHGRAVWCVCVSGHNSWTRLSLTYIFGTVVHLDCIIIIGQSSRSQEEKYW